jgi:pyrroline-5-carboxylate reductase
MTMAPYEAAPGGDATGLSGAAPTARRAGHTLSSRRLVRAVDGNDQRFRNSHRRRGDDRARRLGHLRVKKWMRKMLNGTKIAFIGSGVMGEAMIKGLLNQGLTTAGCLRASDPWAERLEYIHTTYNVETTADNAAAAREAEIVVLSIKPQSLPKVGRDLPQQDSPRRADTQHHRRDARQHAPEQALSRPHRARHAQHTGTAWQRHDGVDRHRACHRAPAQANRGDSRRDGRNNSRSMRKAFSTMATGLSGSGPGFVLLLIEAMIDAGVHMGFSRRGRRKDGAPNHRRHGRAHARQWSAIPPNLKIRSPAPAAPPRLASTNLKRRAFAPLLTMPFSPLTGAARNLAH